MPGPSGVSSSSLKVIVFVPTICPTICSISLITVPSRTWDLFSITNNASLCVFYDNKGDKMETWAGCFWAVQRLNIDFFSKFWWTRQYHLHWTSFSFAALRTRPSFSFSSSLLLCLIPLGDTHDRSSLFLRFLKLVQSHFPLWWALVSWPAVEQKIMRWAIFWIRDYGFARAGPPKRIWRRIVYWCNQRDVIFH